MTVHAPILIIIIPLIASFLNIIIGLWRKRLCYPLVIITLSLSVISSILILNTVITQGVIHYRLGGW
ncbi:MAG: monovalent cation/H+ antiporter subunit D family protein, partial [Deltaproteobacteria bacterium]